MVLIKFVKVLYNDLWKKSEVSIPGRDRRRKKND
jgi:hypothetical protein